MEHGETIVGEPAVSTLAGRGLRAGRSRADPDPTGQQLAAGGGWACSRFSRVLQGLIAVALEAAFEPVPLRPLPALGRHPRGFRVPAYRPRGGFLRAGVRVGLSRPGEPYYRPSGPGIDNLLSMFLRRYFEGLQQLADFVLDGLIMILQRAAILEGERGIGFGLHALARIGLSTCSRTIPTAAIVRRPDSVAA